MINIGKYNQEVGNVNNSQLIQTCGDNNNINVGVSPIMTDEEIMACFDTAGSHLKNYRNTIADNYHIDRPETIKILEWLKQKSNEPKNRVCALLGNAGQGKTVVMRDLLEMLKAENIPALGIKADAFAVENATILKSELGLRIEVIDAIKQISKKHDLFVLVIDQIDALSMSLSSNRSPLATYNRLIQAATMCPNVKIALSCRSFDWDYDSILSGYQQYSCTFKLQNLPIEKVAKSLERIGDNIYSKKSTLQIFLCTPLHLYLYCYLHNYVKDKENITLNDLYNKLWDKVVLSPEAKGNNVECLRYISNIIYEKQQLHIHSNLVNTKFPKEKGYLSSNNFLTEELGLRPTIQFIHQSLFDYVYARLFFESNKHLLEDILAEHQGLFIRARIKQYFQYLRDVDEQQYIVELREFIINPDIRFHIKHLLVTWLGNLSNPRHEERRLVEECILPNNALHNSFAGAICTIGWFNFLVNRDNLKNRIIDSDKEAINEASILCYRIGYDNEQSDYLIDFLSDLIDARTSSATKFVIENFENVHNYNSLKLKSLFKKIHISDTLFTPYDYLEYIVEQDPQLVANVLGKQVKTTLNEKKESFRNGFRWDYQYEKIYKKLCLIDWKAAAWMLLHNIEELSQHTAFQNIKGKKLYQCGAYYMYERGGAYLETSDKWVIDIRKILKRQSVAEITPYVEFLENSQHCISKLILIDLYTNRLNEYYTSAFALVSNLDILNNLDSNTRYYMFQLLKSIFEISGDEERIKIINNIKQILPSDEKYFYKPANPGGPYNHQGYTRCNYYYAIGEENLKKYDCEALKDYQELHRKYPHVNNDKPSKIEVHIGWIGIKQEALNRMSDGDLLDNMAKVIIENNHDFTKPTPQGYAIQLGKMAKNEYHRFIGLLKKAFDKKIHFIYKYEILKGLMEAEDSKSEEISLLFIRLINELMLQSSSADGDIIALVHLCEYYTKKNLTIPNEIFNFICDVAANYDDTQDSHYNDDANMTEDNESDLYNTGINQVRGAAAYQLIQYHYQDNAYPKILETFNKIAENGNTITRSAMLFCLGVLGYKDSEAMTRLYIKTVSRDFNASLLHLPLNDCSPVVLALNLQFDIFLPFLIKIVNGDYSNDKFAVVCWCGWLWGKEPCKDLLFTLLRQNPKARAEWIRYVSYDMPTINHKDKYLAVLHQIMPYLDNEMARFFDYHFNHICKVITNWNEVESIVDSFVSQSNSNIATHDFLSFLERNTLDHPEKCLDWTIQLLDMQSKSEFRITHRLVDIMFNCYNAIRFYKKGNELEEKVMAKFDQILSDTDECKTLIPYLNKLDE